MHFLGLHMQLNLFNNSKRPCAKLMYGDTKLHKKFIMDFDALGNGIGALVMQEGHPLAFTSHPIKGKNLKNPIYEKEMLEILQDLKQWCLYLIGRHFKAKTDHDSLKYFLE